MAREELEFLIVEEVAKATIKAGLHNCLRRIKTEKKKQQSLVILWRKMNHNRRSRQMIRQNREQTYIYLDLSTLQSYSI